MLSKLMVDLSISLNSILTAIIGVGGSIYAIHASQKQKEIHALVNSTLTKMTEQRDALESENLALRKQAIDAGVAHSDLPDSIMLSEIVATPKNELPPK